MITSIKGIFTGHGIDWAEISVGGVTLKASVPRSAVDALGQVGKEIRLFTTLHVRDDTLTLYGFPDLETRSAFEALTAVNGVGPRGALNVLSDMGPEMLAVAIESGDINAFKSVHGVGQKTASRIVLELKGKLDFSSDYSPKQNQNTELIEALISLGYTMTEVTNALSSLEFSEKMQVEERLRITLNAIGGI
jgi:Holliday junction DNA helicase RuvA